MATKYKMSNGQRVLMTDAEEADIAISYTPPTAFEQSMKNLRTKRNSLLTESDWTQGQDSPLTDSKKTEWATYRTNLRNLTNGLTTVEQVNGVTWPTKPS